MTPVFIDRFDRRPFMIDPYAYDQMRFEPCSFFGSQMQGALFIQKRPERRNRLDNPHQPISLSDHFQTQRINRSEIHIRTEGKLFKYAAFINQRFKRFSLRVIMAMYQFCRLFDMFKCPQPAPHRRIVKRIGPLRMVGDLFLRGK